MVKVDKSTGLITHYIGTTVTSFAGTDAQYNEGQTTRLAWETTVDDILQDDYDGVVPDTITRFFTLGDGWYADDEGLLVHEDDEMRGSKGLEPRDFKLSSFFGNFLALVIDPDTTDYKWNYEVNDGGPDIEEVNLAGVGKYLETQGYNLDDRIERNPKIWEGLTFEYRGIVVNNRDGSSYNRVVPVRFFSAKDGASQSSPSTTQSVNTSGSNNTWYDFVKASSTPDQADELNKLLNSAKNQTDFVKQAIKVKGVSDNEALMAILVADDGPWAERNA